MKRVYLILAAWLLAFTLCTQLACDDVTVTVVNTQCPNAVICVP